MKSRKTGKVAVSLKAFFWECSTRIAKTVTFAVFLLLIKKCTLSFVASVGNLLHIYMECQRRE